MATESPKIMSYFIPDLGPAPKWCSYLDNITDELDEESQPAVYDDYKFVTREELEALGASPPQPPFRGASPVIQQYLLPTPPCLRYSPCKPCALSPPTPMLPTKAVPRIVCGAALLSPVLAGMDRFWLSV